MSELKKKWENKNGKDPIIKEKLEQKFNKMPCLSENIKDKQYFLTQQDDPKISIEL